MASRTLYDQPATSLHWDNELTHVKPCINVKFAASDSALHQQACDVAREKAFTIAVHMLDVVLTRATANTEDVISSMPPFNKSASLLSVISSSSSSSSSSSFLSPRLPPLEISGREYSMDAVCNSVRTVVELDGAAALYSRLENSIKTYAMHVLQRLSVVCDEDTAGDLTFMRLAHLWGHYRLAVAELQEIWVFFDRWYVSRTRAVRSIEGLAVAVMKTELLQHQWLLPRAQEGFLAFLHRDLHHEGDARRELFLFTNLCTAIEVYFLRVEQEILTVVSQFLKEEADRMWQSGVSAEFFFQQVHTYLQDGRQRVHACLNDNTMPKLEGVMQTSLLTDHGMDILTRDFAQLIEQKKYDCVRHAWLFLASGPYVKLGKQCGALFRQYILGKGAAIMQRLSSRPFLNGEEGFSVVGAIMSLIFSSEAAIQQCFAEDSMFFTVQMNDALGEVLHLHQTEFAQQLAACVDWLMREAKEGTLKSTGDCGGGGGGGNGGSSLPDATTAGNGSVNNYATRSLNELPLTQQTTSSSSSLNAVAALCPFPFSFGDVLKYIWRIYTLFPSKEIFETFYWRDLARRLLHFHHFPNIDVEESFIQGLKKTCGVETSKFEGMVNDIKLSHGLNGRYQTWATGERDGTSSSWQSFASRVEGAEEDTEEKGVKGREDEECHYQQERCGQEGIAKKRRKEERNIGGGKMAKVGNSEAFSAIPSLSSNVNNSDNAEVQLSILTTTFWPKQTALTLLLPKPLCTLAERIQDFYRQSFTGRRLVWQHQISSAVLTYVFGAVQRQLSGNLLQVAMLLAMQEMTNTKATSMASSSSGGVLTVGALCERLGVDMSLPLVASSLLGMCHPKFRLLLREPAASGGSYSKGGLGEFLGSNSYHDDNRNNNCVSEKKNSFSLGCCSKPSIAASDRVCFNPHFNLAPSCSRIPLYNARHDSDGLTVEGSGGENMQTPADVIKEQSHVIEAAVVRLMKEKRRIGHEELMAAIPALVRFPLNASSIKHVIERLINRGFLERNAQAVYTYI